MKLQPCCLGLVALKIRRLPGQHSKSGSAPAMQLCLPVHFNPGVGDLTSIWRRTRGYQSGPPASRSACPGGVLRQAARRRLSQLLGKARRMAGNALGQYGDAISGVWNWSRRRHIAESIPQLIQAGGDDGQSRGQGGRSSSPSRNSATKSSSLEADRSRPQDVCFLHHCGRSAYRGIGRPKSRRSHRHW